MYPAGRLTRLAVLALSAATLGGCAGMRVNSYFPTGADLRQYQTYAWGPTEHLETGDPRLDNNPFFSAQIQASVERELAGRGFEKVTAGAPELRLHYHASITQRIDLTNVDGNDPDGGKREAYVYDAGTLVIDFVDARTNRLVWRGWAEASLDGIIDRQELLEERVDKAVARIMERFPAS